MKKQDSKEVTSSSAKVSVNPTILSPHNEAIYEVGKKMMMDSLEISRHFSEFMITTTIGSIPIYLALLGLTGFEPKSATVFQKLMALAPAPVFLLSFYLFILAYFPKRVSVSLDVIERIKEAHTATLNKRIKFLTWALVVYTLAIGISLTILFFFR